MDVVNAFDRVPFLRALPPEERDRLLPYAELRVLGRGEHLWELGGATGEVCFVVRGRVKLVKASESGREAILEMGSAGELLCASAACSFLPYCCSAASMEEETEVVIVQRRDLLDILERNTAASRAFIREVACRGMALCRRVEELSSGLVERRIATLLLRLAERMGVPRNGHGLWIPVPLSRQDLADLTGTTLETAIRIMSRLGREGVVQTAARGFVILDRKALDNVVRGGTTRSSGDGGGAETGAPMSRGPDGRGEVAPAEQQTSGNAAAPRRGRK